MGGYTSLVVFLAMYFITLWVAWRIAVWMTTPKVVPDGTGAGSADQPRFILSFIFFPISSHRPCLSNCSRSAGRHRALQDNPPVKMTVSTRYKSGTLKRARSNCDHAAEGRLSCEPVLNRPDISEH